MNEIIEALYTRLGREAAVVDTEQQNHCKMLQLNNGATIYLFNNLSSVSSPPAISVRLGEGKYLKSVLEIYPLPDHFSRRPSETRFVIDINGLPPTLPDTSPVPQLFAMVLNALREILTKETIRRTRVENTERIEE